MKITLIDAGKRFNRDWIFRHVHYEFLPGHSYAITGPNGSGKSTLLQAIAGAIGISEGSLRYSDSVGSGVSVGSLQGGLGEGVVIPADQAYRYLSIAAPYLEVIEEMTVTEFLRFHAGFKPLLAGWDVRSVIAEVGLAAAADKQIRYYSSGMRQRVRLAQALFSDTSVVLLDEPCTNLDVEGIELYRRLIDAHAHGRMVVVSSNDKVEYDFCTDMLSILDYKG